jgi:hypothetical protein
LNAGVEVGGDGDAAVDDEQRRGVGDGRSIDSRALSKCRQLMWVSPMPSARGRKRAPEESNPVRGSVAPWVKWMTSINNSPQLTSFAESGDGCHRGGG